MQIWDDTMATVARLVTQIDGPDHSVENYYRMADRRRRAHLIMLAAMRKPKSRRLGRKPHGPLGLSPNQQEYHRRRCYAASRR
jgi:hypothetical protein